MNTTDKPATKASAPVTRKLAYYEKSNDPSNYANPLFITRFPDGSTMSTMQESVARKAVNDFNAALETRTRYVKLSPQRVTELEQLAKRNRVDVYGDKRSPRLAVFVRAVGGKTSLEFTKLPD